MWCGVVCCCRHVVVVLVLGPSTGKSGALKELGSRRSAPGFPDTSSAIPPMGIATPARELRQRQQVDPVLLPQPSAVTEGEPLTTPIRQLYVTEALIQNYGPTVGCERCHWGTCRQRMVSLLCQSSKAQEKPSTDDTQVASDRRAEPARFLIFCSRHGHLPSTFTRAVGKVEDSEVEDGQPPNVSV